MKATILGITPFLPRKEIVGQVDFALGPACYRKHWAERSARKLRVIADEAAIGAAG